MLAPEDLPVSSPLREKTAASIARAAIVVIAIGALTVCVYRDATTLRRVHRETNVAAWRATYAQERCIYRALRSALPKKARVVVLRETDVFYEQLLVELLTSWAVPTSAPNAEWAIALVPGNTCAGFALNVRRT